MKITKAKLIYYSPTNTGKRTVAAIRKGTELDYDHIDLTSPDKVIDGVEIDENQLAIFAVPVYSGRIPGVAVERIRKLKGNNTPAILVAVYGNRAFDDALLELKDLTTELGFKAVAGAAFIGQHSFDSKETPIATGRPDSDDIKKATKFGAQVIQKLEKMDEIPPLEVPGNYPYREVGGGDPRSPETDPEICILCGMCARVCPVGCVEVSDKVTTEKQDCTACTSCVQNCPTGARHWEHEGILKAAKWLSTEHGARREPELFL